MPHSAVATRIFLAAALAAPALTAQSPTLTRPLPTRPIVQLPVVAPAPSQFPAASLSSAAGTGPYMVSVVPTANAQPTALGNATAVTFTDPTAGTGVSGRSVQHGASTIQLQFATNDQLASSLARVPCAMTGCPLTRFYIRTQVGTNIMTWTLANAVVTQLQMASQIVVTMGYTQMMVTTTQQAASDGTTSAPGAASYNIGTAKAQ